MKLKQKTKKMKKLALLCIVMLTVTTNAQSWWGSTKVKGNGNVTTETRTIKNFDAVSVGGSFDVVLVDGNEGKLTIEGEENILPYLETKVEGGTLKINFKNNTNIRTTKRFIVTVPFEDIESVSLGGSGDVKVKKTISANNISFNIGGSGIITADVNGETVKTAIGGSGDIKLTGKSENLKISIGGSGNIKAYGLKTQTIKASVAGSGDIYITVSNKIKATVVGSGNIYYKGNPKHIDTNSLGSGDVIDKN